MMKYTTLLLLLFSFNANAGSFYKHDPTCLALNIYHEARSEPQEGRLAVGMVTLNRVQSKKFPSTVCKVVWEHKQFSWTKDGKPDRPLEKAAWEKAKTLANYLIARYELYQSLTNGDIDITDGALYYYAHNIIEPYWAYEKKVTKVIGGHTFGKDG